MASKIVLHIGLQKSGTTFLQHMLHDNKDALAEAGVRYPVPLDWERGKRTVANHEWSSYGLLGPEFPWVSEGRAAKQSASWQDVLNQVNAWPDTALLSAEALSVIRTPAVHRLLDSLGTADVEVVITARSLGRALPSLWQQHIRNGRSESFARYLDGLAKQREKDVENDADAHIWRAFILGRLVSRWSKAGAARVSVVTTPGRPPRLLWTRFTEAIGVPALARAPLAEEAHTGLTAPETLVLSSLNDTLRENHWPGRDADRVRQLVTDRFQARDQRGGKVTVPSEWRPRVAEWNEQDLTDLRDTSAAIIGEFDDLGYVPETAPPPTPEETARAGAEAALALAAFTPRKPPLHRAARRVRRLLT